MPLYRGIGRLPATMPVSQSQSAVSACLPGAGDEHAALEHDRRQLDPADPAHDAVVAPALEVLPDVGLQLQAAALGERPSPSSVGRCGGRTGSTWLTVSVTANRNVWTSSARPSTGVAHGATVHATVGVLADPQHQVLQRRGRRDADLGDQPAQCLRLPAG